MSLEPGHRLGPYEIVAPLGAGGMGEVYKLHDLKLDRLVAAKIIRCDRRQTVALAEFLAVPKSTIRIVRGQSSRKKLVEID